MNDVRDRLTGQRTLPFHLFAMIVYRRSHAVPSFGVEINANALFVGPVRRTVVTTAPPSLGHTIVRAGEAQANVIVLDRQHSVGLHQYRARLKD